jgi:hypothetical protein
MSETERALRRIATQDHPRTWWDPVNIARRALGMPDVCTACSGSGAQWTHFSHGPEASICWVCSGNGNMPDDFDWERWPTQRKLMDRATAEYESSRLAG